MRVVAIGRNENLYNSILKLKETDHDVVLVITCRESPGYRIVPQDFKLLAEKSGIDFIQTENINSAETIQIIKRYKPDIGISASWITIIGQEVIDCFPYGIINAHMGDLPRYRGNATPNWAIIHGEKKVVLTLHLMTTELDAGPIIIQREMPISDKASISDVYRFSLNSCPDMFLQAINGFANDSIEPHYQPKNPSLSLRCYPRTPKDGEIDWTQKSIELDRLVRAVSEPFTGAYTFLGTEKLTVWKAHYEVPPYPFLGTPGQVAERRPNTGEVAIVTGEGFLVLEEVEIESSGRRRATEIIKTIRQRLGMDITGEIVRISEEIENINKTLEEIKKLE